MSESGARHARAATAPDAADPALRGRTLAVPFEHVWQAATRLTNGGLRGWQLHDADDYDGVITATADAWLGEGHDVVITVHLDADAQTRVDATATPRAGGADFGRAARRLRQFFRALDRALHQRNTPVQPMPETR